MYILHEFVQEMEPSIPWQKESAEKDSRLEAPLRRNSVAAFKKEERGSLMFFVHSILWQARFVRCQPKAKVLGL